MKELAVVFGGLFVAFLMGFLIGSEVEVIIYNKRVSSGNQFIINHASYKCNKTNELKEGQENE